MRVISKGHAYTGAKTEHELVGPAAYNYPDQPGVFHSGDEMPRHNWEKVELPHDYTVLNAPCPTENQALGYLKKEDAWYRKHFTAQPEWEHKRVTLLFEGVSTECVIYLNGCRLYRNFSAYNSFEVDLTNYLYFEKENVLAVYTTLNDFEGWWYQGGGIYRNVWLNITAPVYINLWGVYAKPALLQQNNWKLDLETDLQNKTYEAVKVTVISELLAANKTYVTAYDKTVLAGWFITRAETEKHLNSEPYIMGGYQWSAFEHRGESQWPRLCSQSGAIDFYLQKKDSFFQNKINWTNEPAVHILPNHWNFKGLNGQPICVAVYTNCQTAELFLNGRSLGKKQAERYGVLSWQVAYEPGELLCKAQNGSTTVQAFVKTTGQPETLRLTRMNLDPPTVENVLLFTLECLDKNGCVVENAAETVRFFCNENGRVLATGSDVCDHTPPACPVRKMRAGKITVAVKVLKELAPLKLYAESEHCGFTVIEVK